MTYLEAIEDALERFPDMPVEMRQAFYTVLLVGDVTEEEAAANRDLYQQHAVLHTLPTLLLPTTAPIHSNKALYNQWVKTYNQLLKR